MTSQFIFDIIVRYKHTKEKQEEFLKQEKEREEKQGLYVSEKYFPRQHAYVLTQVKITTDYDIRAALLSAFKITDEINADLDKYISHKSKEFDYWVVPILGKFFSDEIIATTYKGD